MLTCALKQHPIKKLFSAEEFGDCMPSQVTQHIQQLLGSMAATMDARELFLQHLPPNVSMVLTPCTAALTLDQLTQLADQKLHLLQLSPRYSVNCTSHQTQLLTTINTFFWHPQLPSPGR